MMTRKQLFMHWLIAISLLCLLTTAATADDTRVETSLSDGGKAVIVFTGYPLKTMTETPFAIKLFNSASEPINNAKLTLSLTMPFMPMPPNHPNAIWSKDAYYGNAVFTMAGVWQVNVDIERPTVAPEKIIFDIEMVIMK